MELVGKDRDTCNKEFRSVVVITHSKTWNTLEYMAEINREKKITQRGQVKKLISQNIERII